jgi:tetratricopeptide (TPR) repeat protein
MLFLLNPLKWWRRFWIKRRWRKANSQFANFYARQDWKSAESVAKLMIHILAGAGLWSLLLDSHYSLMLCYHRMERFDEAILEGELVLELQCSLTVDPDDQRVPKRMCNLASLYHLAGRVDDAFNLYRQALVLQRRIDGGKGSKRCVDILEYLAIICLNSEREEDARNFFEEAQGYRRNLRLFGDSQLDELERSIKQIKLDHYRDKYLTDFELWQNLTGQVVKLRASGDITKAILISEQALEIAEKIFPVVCNDIVQNLNDLAELYKLQSRWAEAEAVYIKALEIRKRLFHDLYKPHNDLAVSFNNLAELYEFQGRQTEAEPLYEQALKIQERLRNQRNNDLKK